MQNSGEVYVFCYGGKLYRRKLYRRNKVIKNIHSLAISACLIFLNICILVFRKRLY